MTENQANMMLWHESIAKRGSRDIASCILWYIKSNFQKINDNEDRKLIVWSDRCVGQNNNKTMLCLFKYLIDQHYFSEIHQKFMVTGHSFLPCDRDFAMIERTKKKSKALVPSDWKYIIGRAFLNTPFQIKEMVQEEFKNFDILIDAIFVKNPKFQITKYAWFKLCRDDPLSVLARPSHNVNVHWKIFNLFKIPTNEVRLSCLYQCPLPISKEKKKDLLEMTQYLTSLEHVRFYKELPSQ